MVKTSRLRQIGWALILSVCFGMLLALTFKVNAVKSDVRLVERQIVAAERSKLMLETEFQTRASQHQLSTWNAVEFGYQAPRADQFLDGERQLAALGQPRGSNAPEPIRVAVATAVQVPEEDGLFADWLDDEDTGSPARGDDAPARRDLAAATTLAQRLARPTPSVAGVVEATQ